MKVLVTGSNGFIGKNLSFFLRERGHEVLPFDKENTLDELKGLIDEADFVIHLAGVNRPLDDKKFTGGNVNLTKALGDLCVQSSKKPPIAFASSRKAEGDTPYGISKKQAEDYLLGLYEKHGYPVYVIRLDNVFGKWCRPSYNSVIATFCYNTAHGLPIGVNKDAGPIPFIYIDDVCKGFISLLDGDKERLGKVTGFGPVYIHRLEEIASALRAFRDYGKTLWIDDQDSPFWKYLYSVYLTYEDERAHSLDIRADDRGSFTEIFKSRSGQVSVNIGKPGIIKGNHYHHTKHEKFVVVKGKCLIALRKLGSKEVIEYTCDGGHPTVVDIPAGFTHSIKTLGDEESVTVMWANEAFDPDNPDTYREEVYTDGE